MLDVGDYNPRPPGCHDMASPITATIQVHVEHFIIKQTNWFVLIFIKKAINYKMTL